MFDSKAIKDFGDPPKRSKLYYWWIDSTIGDWYYWFVRKFIKNPIFKMKRLYGWQVNVFYNDYDYDAHSIFGILEYKLKRIKEALDRGHAVQEPTDMKALKLAIKLAGRLREDMYDVRGYDKHDKKWGELKSWSTPCEDKPGYVLMNFSRPNANTDEEKELELQEFKRYHELSYKTQKRDQRWLFGILDKYIRVWWD
jgi:hypothetical protein